MHPHWLSLPRPPQTSGAVHLPQSSASEHPSDSIPQEAPICAQDFALQAANLWTLEPPTEASIQALAPDELIGIIDRMVDEPDEDDGG